MDKKSKANYSTPKPSKDIRPAPVQTSHEALAKEVLSLPEVPPDEVSAMQPQTAYVFGCRNTRRAAAAIIACSE